MTTEEATAKIDEAIATFAKNPVRGITPVPGVDGATIHATPYSGPRGDGWALRANYSNLVRIKITGPETERERAWSERVKIGS